MLSPVVLLGVYGALGWWFGWLGSGGVMIGCVRLVGGGFWMVWVSRVGVWRVWVSGVGVWRVWVSGVGVCCVSLTAFDVCSVTVNHVPVLSTG